MVKNNKIPFVIIGAGIAGLAAATELNKKSQKTIVLEAQNKIGGRIQTDYSLGIPISLGPQWLHGLEHNPIAKIADQLGLSYQKTDLAKFYFYSQNKNLIPKEITADFFNEVEYILAEAKRYAFHQPQDLSLLSALKNINTHSYSPEWLELFELQKYFCTLWAGGSLENLSGRYWDQEEELSGGNHLLLPGFTPVVNHLAKNCQILLNTKVAKIIYDKSSVTIETNQGDFTAEKVLLTVPLGVLQKNVIQFEPALPPQKIIAFKKLSMGVLDSVVLKFPKVFWPADCYGLGISGQELDFRFFVNLNYFQHAPILTARAAGKHAYDLENYTDQELIAKVMRSLTKIFGASIPEPEDYLITRWGRDPYSFGSYSYIPVGSTGEECDWLAEPVENKIFFAGEATHRRHLATIHGAYLSGIREAKHIISG